MAETTINRNRLAAIVSFVETYGCDYRRAAWFNRSLADFRDVVSFHHYENETDYGRTIESGLVVVLADGSTADFRFDWFAADGSRGDHGYRFDGISVAADELLQPVELSAAGYPVWQ